jgi:predicted DNA-binding ribbon-helix-helix protein
MPSQKKQRVGMLMPPDLIEQLEDLAEWRTTSFSAEVRVACVEYLSRQVDFPRRNEPVDEQAAA